MTRIHIDKQMLIAAIACNTDASEQDARSIVASVLAIQPREHDGECATDKYARDVCEGTYADKVDECLDLVEALRAVYALAGEQREVRDIIDQALKDYE